MMIFMSKLKFAKTPLYGLLPCLILVAAAWANAATTKVITVAGGYAGNGTSGYSGDGGPATEASLAGPTSLFVDSANNIYITDAFNYVVRKVDAAGVIHTVAGNNKPGFAGDGGPATSAQISYSSGI